MSRCYWNEDRSAGFAYFGRDKSWKKLVRLDIRYKKFAVKKVAKGFGGQK
jgi:hypothetical protein